VLCYATGTVWPSGPRCAALIPWLQDKLCWLIVTQEPGGSSQWSAAVIPPACPCHDKKHSNKFPRVHFFHLSVEMINRIAFFLSFPFSLSNLYKCSEDQNVRSPPLGRSAWCTAPSQKGRSTSHSAQHLQGHKITNVLLSFFTMLAPENCILSNTLWHYDLAGIITTPHLPGAEHS